MKKKVTPYLKMKVLGALEFADGATLVEQYKAVSKQIFKDEEGHPHQFTWRTIQTWHYYYRQHGITEPKKRIDANVPRKASPEELLVAIEKALPHFNGKRLNVTAVYRKCIEIGALKSDQIAASTFRRHVKKFDLLKPESKVASKRRQAFSKAHVHDMWQCDTMHGPTLNLDGKKQKVYLLAFMDDASRFITHAEFYLSDSTASVIDCFQQALFKCGIPRAMYVDNGSNYCSPELAKSCTRIGTLLIHTPVRDGAAKGKIERFFRTIRDRYLIQNLSHLNTLESLNENLRDWIADEYHHKRHSILDMKPIDRFGMEFEKIQWLQPSAYNKEIFYHEVQRSVRADNTFQHNNVRYEPPHYLAGSKITIRFDRHNPLISPVVYHEDIRLGEATPINLIENDRANHRRSTNQ